MNTNAWKRVTTRRPCPVCKKPDWCIYTGDDSAPTAAICARIESDRQAGEAGWLHRLRDDGWTPVQRRTVPVVAKRTGPNVSALAIVKLAETALLRTPLELLERLGDRLGVSAQSLRRLSVGRLPSRKAWGFPMRNACHQIVGIRLRCADEKKLSVRGGREGLFMPGLRPDGRFLICEGEATQRLVSIGVFKLLAGRAARAERNTLLPWPEN